MFAVHYRDDKLCDYVGEVFSETGDRVRIQVCDAIMLTGSGLWQLSDEVVDVPRSECRFFLSEEAAADACAAANAHIMRRCGLTPAITGLCRVIVHENSGRSTIPVHCNVMWQSLIDVTETSNATHPTVYSRAV